MCKLIFPGNRKRKSMTYGGEINDYPPQLRDITMEKLNCHFVL